MNIWIKKTKINLVLNYLVIRREVILDRHLQIVIEIVVEGRAGDV